MTQLFDWFRDSGWIGWGLLAIGLAAAELLTLDLTLLMLAVGALAAGITWFIAPSLVWLQAIVAVVVAGLTLSLLRPSLLERVRNSPGYRSSLDQLMGASGTATAEITNGGGEVRVDGQIWQARPYDPSLRIREGQSIEVFGMDGITLLVHPSSSTQIPQHFGPEGN